MDYEAVLERYRQEKQAAVLAYLGMPDGERKVLKYIPGPFWNGGDLPDELDIPEEHWRDPEGGMAEKYLNPIIPLSPDWILRHAVAVVAKRKPEAGDFAWTICDEFAGDEDSRCRVSLEWREKAGEGKFIRAEAEGLCALDAALLTHRQVWEMLDAETHFWDDKS